MEVSGKLHTPATLPPGKEPQKYWTFAKADGCQEMEAGVCLHRDFGKKGVITVTICHVH
jgi:hypothetical protein